MDQEQKDAKIQKLLEARYPVTLTNFAEALDCTDLAAAQQLPEHMRTFAPGTDFEKIWQSACNWESATVLVIHLGNVFEFNGKLPAGKLGGGYFNLLGGDSSLQGHLRENEVKNIAFLSIPFMDRESHCIAFFDETGTVMYYIYVGRKDHQLIASAKAAFLELASDYR